MNNVQIKQQRWYANIILVIVSLVVAIGISEWSLRHFYSEHLQIYSDERNLLYRYDKELGWFPLEQSSKTVTAKQTIKVDHNSRGFRDKEHLSRNKPGIIFLGDSFVWGFDVNASERFTDKLSVRLPDWNVYNLGVSGYGTDQELLLLMQQFDFYKPRIVFLMFCNLNDEMDNATNVRYRGYYKPYFVAQDQQLVLKGIPVPKSLNYYAKEFPLLMKSFVIRLVIKAFSPPVVQNPHPTGFLIRRLNEFVNQKGSVLAVGLLQPHQVMETFLRDIKVPYVVLNAEISFQYSEHWSPAGHTAVSNQLHDFLLDSGLLNAGAKSPR